jgi:hypothetical protein
VAVVAFTVRYNHAEPMEERLLLVNVCVVVLRNRMLMCCERKCDTSAVFRTRDGAKLYRMSFLLMSWEL